MTNLYLIHRARLPNRRVNLDRTYVWFKWLVDQFPDCAIMAPWTSYCESLDEETYRERGMRDGKALIQSIAGRTIGMVCGPQMTDGCRADVANLSEMGHGSIDLTGLGLLLPPEPTVMWDTLLRAVKLVIGRMTATADHRLWVVTGDAKFTLSGVES